MSCLLVSKVECSRRRFCVAAATVTLTVGFTAAGTVGLNMYLLSNSLGRTFTNDTRVLQVGSSLVELK